MKKYIIFLLTILLSLIGSNAFAQNETFDDGTVWNCDQNFAPTAVRYWKLYSFNDTWNNGTNSNTYLNDYFVQYKNASYLNQGQAFGNGRLFDWTQALKNASYTIAPNSSMQILSTQFEDWGIVQKPATRSNPAMGQYDFMIAYKVNYDKSNNYPDASDDISHVECQPYYVTWCGDGIKDAAYEQCDGTDGITAGQTCNSSCQIVNNPLPVCTNLTSSVLIGNSPVSTNVSCTSQNATTVSIDCGNGQAINSASGTCTYTTPGYYSAVCKVDGTITNANCQKNIQVNPPVLAACVPGTRTGPQTSALTASSSGLCPSGQSVGWNTPTTAGTVTTYTWSCNGSAVGGACSATFDTSTVACVPGTTVGNRTGAVLPTTPGLCQTGVTVTDFILIHSGATDNYSWSCGGSAVGGACTANFTPLLPDSPVVSIRKYAKEITLTGDSQSAPVSIALGERFNYYYLLQNTGSVAATGVVVKDTLPKYLTFSGAISVKNPAGTDVTNDWTCIQGSQVFAGDTMSRITVVCTKKTPLPANSGIYTFAVPVVLALNTPTNSNMQNIAYVCVENATSNPTGPNGETICGNTNPPPPPPPDQCTPTNNPNKDPACIVVTGSGFDLSLKKYIGTNDAQSRATGVSTTTNGVLSYVIRVTNSGPVSSSGVTTVQDILPTGVEYDTAATGSGWICAVTTRTLRCTTTQVVVGGSSYPDITVPFRVTATAGQEVTNIAAVDNPNETNRCNTNGTLPATDTVYCNKDPTNSDPAILYVSGGSIGGGDPYYVPTCVNGLNTCSQQVYNSIQGCQVTTGQTCYNTLADCNRGNTLTCSGGSNGGGGGGFCGDGVLGSSLGEECDVIGAAWCGQRGAVDECKIKLNTTPGQNPITSMWIQIPALSKTKNAGKTTFLLDSDITNPDAYKIVVGKDTNVFALADQLIFGMKTQFQIPLMIDVDKKMCLQSTGMSLNNTILCTTFGNTGTPTTVNGHNYIILGGGTYQTRLSDGRYENVIIESPVHEATLFQGSKIYSLYDTESRLTLRDAFKGAGNAGDDGMISLFGCSRSDCSTTAVTTMISIPVRVSGVVVSSIGSSSNRDIEQFINQPNLFVGFLGSTISNTSTTTSNNVGTATVNLPTIVGGPTGSAGSVTNLERYAVNGNRNILAVNGNLTIENCLNNTFVMSGVRTVIVNGDLVIKCNIVYGTNDTTSSWAWISKGGDIQVSNGNRTLNIDAVTNLAGVYVAVQEGTRGGKITHTDATTTQAILRVEGTLYGNATPLFNSRLYARATGAYDILTTGTILTYSNRALISPPPLLSQYLGAYQVQRVVQ